MILEINVWSVMVPKTGWFMSWVMVFRWAVIFINFIILSKYYYAYDLDMEDKLLKSKRSLPLISFIQLSTCASLFFIILFSGLNLTYT